MIKSEGGEMHRVCSTYEKLRNEYKIMIVKNGRKRSLDEPGVDERTV
jgi:hypothetical protein